MKDQAPKLRLTYSQIYTCMGWFLFQEQNDIHTEQSSLSINEIRFSNKLNIAATKMKDAPKGSFIFITSDEAKIAHDWFKNLSKTFGSFIDKKDQQMYACLDVFVEKK